ncbi:MAG: hypothetical protein U0X86_000405 [Wolbachia endosymbiont of Xenopsylla cheopis]
MPVIQLVSSLLKVNALTISELQNKSIKEITQKVETLTKEKISKNQEQLELPTNLSKCANLSYVENEAQSLQTFAVAKVVECLQNKNTFLKEAEVTNVKVNSSMRAIS